VTAADRWAADGSRPTPHEFWGDLARRALAPGAALWAVVTGTGLLVVGPLDDLPAEDAAVRELASARTPVLDALTAVWSALATTEVIIGACVVTIVALWWWTRQWWLAVVPAIAVAVQAAVFMTAALAVARERPDAVPLEIAPPTSSFPSGHVGASTAFCLTLAVLARRIRHPALRWLATVACLLVPVLVAYARLYRGMHHPTDVVAGAVVGAVCAWLAWHYLRRGGSRAGPGERRGTLPEGPGRVPGRTG
jgi:membrane-associated phospholipid phosphatase